MKLGHIKETKYAVAAPHYELRWRDSSCEWAASPRYPSKQDQLTFPYALLPEQHLDFNIVAQASSMASLLVRLATYDRANTSHLWCELVDLDGATLRRAFVPTNDIIDNALNEILNLEGLVFQIGATYRVRLFAPTATEFDGIAVWTAPIEEGLYEIPTRLVRFRNDRTFVYEGGRLETDLDEERSYILATRPGSDLGFLVEAAQVLCKIIPDQEIEVLELDRIDRYWPTLAAAAVVFFAEDPEEKHAPPDDSLYFELYRRGVTTVALDLTSIQKTGYPKNARFTGGVRSRIRKLREQLRRSEYTFSPKTKVLIEADEPDCNLWDKSVDDQAHSIARLADRKRAKMFPKVAIVSVLYRKASIIEAFMDHVIRQTYPGEITVVLVNDCSPENDTELARMYKASLSAQEIKNRKIEIVQNSENLGNCTSRNKGISAVDADIYIVMDCDCLINSCFVASHVFEHSRPDVDVVIGHLNIESHEREARDVVAELESNPNNVAQVAEPQDSVQKDGFLNCITRNFSIKRRATRPGPLFDVDFSYSSKPDSGFGWEDVEMGFRLYAKGSVIRFTDLAFAVHASHPSSANEAAKIQGSIRNFERLYAKHPEMELVSRRWSLDTFDKILSWARNTQVDGGEPQRALERRFSAALELQRPLLSAYRGHSRPLRILSYRWHVPHQYELYKLPHHFTLVTDIGENGMVDAWSHDQRPLRPNVTMTPACEVDPNDYDLAILHFDENVLATHVCNNVIPAVWGDPFRWLLGVSELPKVAICHGTPQFTGQYGLDPNRQSAFTIHQRERLQLKSALADAQVRVVCNSWQAHKEWDFDDSRVIWHGFDPQEFPPGTLHQDILALEPDNHRPHYRGAWEHAAVARRLDPGIEIKTAEHLGAAIDPRGTNDYAIRNFRSYVDRIRQFKFYLNTTLRSPMPRSRGEAMMTGVIPVCLRNHDVDRFIENGISGFYSDEPEELADWINSMCRRPEEIERVSKAARQTALDLFNHDRYLGAWTDLINETVGI